MVPPVLKKLAAMQVTDPTVQLQTAVSPSQNFGSPLRVLFLTDAFLPHAGGARVYYYNLLQHLVRFRENRVTVLTKKVPGWKEFDKHERTEHFRMIRSGRPLENWKYYQWPRIAGPLARVLPLVVSGRFDLIHFGDLYPQGVLSLALKRALGMPYLAYCHGEEITQVDGRRYQPKVRDAIFREADAVVAANEFARHNLLRIGVPEERIQKIVPGVDCVRFRPQPAPEEFIRIHGLQGKRVLLTVARLVARKGHRVVLEAMRKLLPEMPNLVYIIAGTGPEEQKLRRLAAEWNLESAVRFAGFVKDADLASYYNAADVYVMPNSEEKGDVEGFGMVFLEANACGKPVIGGRSGGAAEAVVEGRTGMLVDPYDSQELANALAMMLRNEAIRGVMGEQGRLRAQKEFSWIAGARLLDETSRRIVAAARTAKRR